MTEVRDLYPEMDAKDLPWLHNRLEELKGSAANYKELSDDALYEIMAITRSLRKRASAPGSGGPRKKSTTPKSSDISSLA